MNYSSSLLALYSPLSIRVAYFFVMIAAAVTWVTQGSVVGSISAGIFAGMLVSISTGMGAGRKSILEEISSGLGFFVLIGLYFLKSSVIMPVTWVPPDYFDLVGMVILIVTTLGVEFAFNPPSDTDRIVKSPVENKIDAVKDAELVCTEQKPLTFFGKVAPIVGMALAITSVLIQVSLVYPEKLSTPQIALNRYIYNTAYSAFGNKHSSDMEYFISSRTDAKVSSYRVDGNKLFAELTISAPVIKELTPKLLTDPVEYNKFIRSDYAKVKSTDLTQSVVLEKSGLGWKLVSATPIPSSLELAKTYSDAKEVKLLPLMLRNMFGMQDMMSGAFNIIWVMWLLVGAAILIVKNRSPLYYIAYGLITLFTGTAPILVLSMV